MVETNFFQSISDWWVKNFSQGNNVAVRTRLPNPDPEWRQIRTELILNLIRLASASALMFFTIRYMVKFIDPTKSVKDDAKTKAKRVLKAIGVENYENLDLNEYEMSIATNLVSNDTDVAWNDIGGCEEIHKELFDRVILPLTIARNGNSLNTEFLQPPKGVLLYGPPGCGKTLTARAIAREAKCRFINLQVSQLADKWYGETQKLTDALFSLAHKIQPCIIFIDEIDSFLRNRNWRDHEVTATMKAQFLSHWDGFADKKNTCIMVIGATNRPNDIDSAIRRRMPTKFQLNQPNASQRASILRVMLRKERCDNDLDYEFVANHCKGLTGSDLREVCRLAALKRAKEIMLKHGDDVSQIKLSGMLAKRPLMSEDLMYGAKEVVISKRKERKAVMIANSGNELGDEGLD